MNKWLYAGRVFHQRFAVKKHQMTHRVFFIRFPLSKILLLKNSFFSLDRWNLLSFHRKDHGLRDGSDLWAWASKKLSEAGVHDPITEIELQTFPRVLGFVFNPVSFWFCYSGDEQVAVIAEVNNTFGETHSYVIPKQGEIHRKVLQVSPFFQITGEYKFTFAGNEKECLAGIHYLDGDEPLLYARIQGQAMDWTPGNLFKVWFGHPLLTFAIVFLIHWHASILYFKRIPFFGKNGIKEVTK